MLRYLALGDSYTIGESVAENQRWPMHLARMLRTDGIDLAEPDIIARTGWTSAELLDSIAQAHLHGPYDLVSLLIGVNNQYRQLPLTEYRVELEHLLQQAIDFAGGVAERVLVVSIPDWGVTPFAAGRDRARIAREIDAFNETLWSTSDLYGAAYVDITPLSRTAGADPGMLADDGLHPSGAMYTQWALMSLAAARRAVQNTQYTNKIV